LPIGGTLSPCKQLPELLRLVEVERDQRPDDPVEIEMGWCGPKADA
jgi:hypothetical protein